MRKNNLKRLTIYGIATLFFALSSCSKIDQFGNVNQNPGAPTSPVTSGLLTNALAGLGGYTWGAGDVGTVTGLYCQYFSETQYTDASTYSKPTFNWDGYYAGALEDLQTIINYNTDETTAASAAQYGSNNNQIATARILKAYIYWFLTDTWGDIPYSGALQLDNGIVSYDSQQSVYMDLMKELKEAVAQFDDGPAFNGDILFNGDISMWKKFANSIRLMMALRLSKADAATGKSEFNDALNADGGVLGEGQNIQLAYPGGAFQNIFYNYYNVVQRKDYAVTDVMIDYLYNTYDDRAYVFGTSTTGFPYGLSRDDAISFANSHTSWARVVGGSTSIFKDGTDFNTETSPMVIISSSEVFLARAEAAYLGWTDESVEENYYTGIAENWKQWDVYSGTLLDIYGGYVLNGDDYYYYIAQDNIALGTENGDDYEKIATQEWICHYPNGHQGFADWRRTGYPALSPGPGTLNSVIPRRVPYGPNEYTLNPTNAAAAAGQYSGGNPNQSTDSQFGKVWWDK